MDPRDRLHDTPGQSIATIRCPIRQTGQGCAQLAIAIGLGQLRFQSAAQTLLILHRAIAQHQMGKIQIEFMRRDIGAFHHEAHVAQGAGIHDRLKIFRVNRVQLFRWRGIDQVKQPREAVTQIKAAAAAMADVKHPAQFRIQLFLVIEIRIIPSDWMAHRRVQTAFPHFRLLSQRLIQRALYEQREGRRHRLSQRRPFLTDS